MEAVIESRRNRRTLAILSIPIVVSAMGCSTVSLLQRFVSDRLPGQRPDHRLAATAERERSQAQFELAEASWRRNDVAGCRRILEEIVSRDPGHRGANLRLAELHLLKKKPQQAVARLKKYCHHHKRDAEAIHLLGLLHEANGNMDLAMACYGRSMNIAKPNAELAPRIVSAKGATPIDGSTAASLPPPNQESARVNYASSFQRLRARKSARSNPIEDNSEKVGPAAWANRHGPQVVKAAYHVPSSSLERRSRSTQAPTASVPTARYARQESRQTNVFDTTPENSRVSSRRTHRLRLTQPQNIDGNPYGRVKRDETFIAQQNPPANSPPRDAVEARPSPVSFRVGQVPQILFGETSQSWEVLDAEESIDEDGVETAGEKQPPR